MTDEHEQQLHFDGEAVGRCSRQVELANVELVEATFTRVDNEPILERPPGDRKPDGVSIAGRWTMADQLLGTVVTFEADFHEDAPWSFRAAFRLTYRIVSEEGPEQSDIDQFMQWNAPMTAYPYFREYLSSTVNRAGLPRFVAPLLRLPDLLQQAATDEREESATEQQ